MKSILYILLLNIFQFGEGGGISDCAMLADGRYLMIFTFVKTESLEVEVNNGSYTQYFKSGDSIVSKMQLLSDCSFKLNYTSGTTGMAATMESLRQQAFTLFGPQCIEIGKIKGDSIPFRITYTQNLHITVNHGFYIGKVSGRAE